MIKSLAVLCLICSCVFGLEKKSEDKEFPIFLLNEKRFFGEDFSMETEAREDWKGNKNTDITFDMTKDVNEGHSYNITGKMMLKKDPMGNDTGAGEVAIRGEWTF